MNSIITLEGLSMPHHFLHWYLRPATALRFLILQLALTVVGMTVAYVSFPGYSFLTHTISELGNRVQSPMWGFFLAQTLTAWFFNTPLLIVAYRLILREILGGLKRPPRNNPIWEGILKGWHWVLVIFLSLGLLVLLVAWVGYAGVGIFDTQEVNLAAHGVATILAFGGLGAGAILWFFPLLQKRRIPKYPIIISLLIIGMAILALNLVDNVSPISAWPNLPWYTRPPFWEWMSFLGSVLWLISIWFSVKVFLRRESPS